QPASDAPEEASSGMDDLSPGSHARSLLEGNSKKMGGRCSGLDAGCQKGIKRGSVTPQNWQFFSPRLTADVKKVPNGRFQGSVPGEIALEDFPLRLLKSLK
ncbi:MAG TPA: hypothetical protein VJ719_14410, partial [Chthoniobacterales bacterium]|nr:hypothetical protein [Chthoniobacterales bacterium]